MNDIVLKIKLFEARPSGMNLQNSVNEWLYENQNNYTKIENVSVSRDAKTGDWYAVIEYYTYEQETNE